MADEKLGTSFEPTNFDPNRTADWQPRMRDHLGGNVPEDTRPQANTAYDPPDKGGFQVHTGPSQTERLLQAILDELRRINTAQQVAQAEEYPRIE